MLVPFFGLVPAGTRESDELDQWADKLNITLVEETKLPTELHVYLDGQVVGSAEFHGLKSRWVGHNPQEYQVGVYNIRIHTPEVMALLVRPAEQLMTLLERPMAQLWPTMVLGHTGDQSYPVLTTVFGIDLIREEELDGEPLV